jgi:hypothetical protein
MAADRSSATAAAAVKALKPSEFIGDWKFAARPGGDCGVAARAARPCLPQRRDDHMLDRKARQPHPDRSLGLEAYGVHSVSSGGDATARALPSAAGSVKWTIMALPSGIVGLLIGAVSIPAIEFIFTPAWKLLTDHLRKR